MRDASHRGTHKQGSKQPMNQQDEGLATCQPLPYVHEAMPQKPVCRQSVTAKQVTAVLQCCRLSIDSASLQCLSVCSFS
jgi:hypothetical protein